ncbi:MAG: DUF2237 domain-containing protein [Phycisphaerales bacterium]|nr:DUF2237 domain-containing protein [Phycisphaerales bacterium]
MDASINVLGSPLKACSHDPLTGWFRDGCCNTDDRDRGSHTVCCRVTTRFLEFLRAQGNDLMTPAPQHGFAGLTEGDQWCVCAASWMQAFEAEVACPVFLEGTHQRALEIVPIEALLQHAIAAQA